MVPGMVESTSQAAVLEDVAAILTTLRTARFLRLSIELSPEVAFAGCFGFSFSAKITGGTIRLGLGKNHGDAPYGAEGYCQNKDIGEGSKGNKEAH
jgi:hypothetical protein